MFRDDRLDTSDVPAPAAFTLGVKDEVSDPTRRRAGPTGEAPADTLAGANRGGVRGPRVVVPRLRYNSQQHSAMSPPGSAGNSLFVVFPNIARKAGLSSPWAKNQNRAEMPESVTRCGRTGSARHRATTHT